MAVGPLVYPVGDAVYEESEERCGARVGGLVEARDRALDRRGGGEDDDVRFWLGYSCSLGISLECVAVNVWVLNGFRLFRRK